MMTQENKIKALSLEEEYFHKHNQELIEKIRERAKKNQIAQEFKCPKCSSKMREVLWQSIPVEKCDSCCGIFLDSAETDEILQEKKRPGLLGLIQDYFSSTDIYPTR